MKTIETIVAPKKSEEIKSYIYSKIQEVSQTGNQSYEYSTLLEILELYEKGLMNEDEAKSRADNVMESRIER